MDPVSQLFLEFLMPSLKIKNEEEGKIIEMVECNGVWVKKDTHHTECH